MLPLEPAGVPALDTGLCPRLAACPAWNTSHPLNACRPDGCLPERRTGHHSTEDRLQSSCQGESRSTAYCCVTNSSCSVFVHLPQTEEKDGCLRDSEVTGQSGHHGLSMVSTRRRPCAGEDPYDPPHLWDSAQARTVTSATLSTDGEAGSHSGDRLSPPGCAVVSRSFSAQSRLVQSWRKWPPGFGDLLTVLGPGPLLLTPATS